MIQNTGYYPFVIYYFNSFLLPIKEISMANPFSRLFYLYIDPLCFFLLKMFMDIIILLIKTACFLIFFWGSAMSYLVHINSTLICNWNFKVFASWKKIQLNQYLVFYWLSRKAWHLITIFANSFSFSSSKNNQSRGQKPCLSARSILLDV